MAQADFDFGKALKELEEITAWFESDSVDLNEGLKKFERGMELSAQLKTHLGQVQNRVEQIKVKFDQASGPTVAEPVAEEPESTSAQLF